MVLSESWNLILSKRTQHAKNNTEIHFSDADDLPVKASFTTKHSNALNRKALIEKRPFRVEQLNVLTLLRRLTSREVCHFIILPMIVYFQSTSTNCLQGNVSEVEDYTHHARRLPRSADF